MAAVSVYIHIEGDESPTALTSRTGAVMVEVGTDVVIVGSPGDVVNLLQRAQDAVLATAATTEPTEPGGAEVAVAP